TAGKLDIVPAVNDRAEAVPLAIAIGKDRIFEGHFAAPVVAYRAASTGGSVGGERTVQNEQSAAVGNGPADLLRARHDVPVESAVGDHRVATGVIQAAPICQDKALAEIELTAIEDSRLAVSGEYAPHDASLPVIDQPRTAAFNEAFVDL